MVNNCAACTKVIKANLQIKCSKCTSTFHPICVDLSETRKLSEEIKLRWLCPMCQSKVPKHDNTNTPVRSSVTYNDDCVNNVTTRDASRKVTALVSPPIAITDPDSLSALATEIRLLREDVGEIKSRMQSLTDHITKTNTRLDVYEKNLALTQDRPQVLEENASVIVSLQSAITFLRTQERSRAQTHLKNEVEITGINETPNENPIHIVRVISQKIGVSIDDKDLDFVMRAGPIRRKEARSSTGNSTDNLPRPLVLRFLRRHQRDEFLKVGKCKRNLTCADIDVPGAGRNIYFNERLTQENRQLFRSARHRCKGAGYKYCWTKNGTVHVRKQDGSQAIPIKTMEDLLDHVNSTFDE